MATYPIKVLLDRNRQPFIPFATTSSIVENGTNRRLDKILGNLDDLQTNNKNSLVSAINEVLVGSGSGAGINIQIVDELPTENISLTTIYFKHMTTGKLHNVYEEWMYINDAWELIGTTEMDLSGYATTTMVGDLSTLKTTDKDCIVDAVNELVDKQLVAGEGIAIDGNVISTSGESCRVYNINTTETLSDRSTYFETNVLNELTRIINNNLDETFILFINSTRNYNKLRFELYFKTPTTNVNNLTDTVYGYSFYDAGEKDTKREFTLKYDKHEDGSILITQFKSTTNPIYELTETDVLTKTNTTSYTPTENYHPATKKYVDDAIAAAGTGSGSAFDPAKYLAIDNTTEYTPTDLYHPATKAYVDSQIASVPEPIDAYSKTEIDSKLANYLSKTNTESYTPTSDYHPATKKFVESVVSSIDMSGYYNKTDIDTKFSDYYNKNNVDTKLANYLAKTNTTAFTPTENYHPATKKYVDDKSATVDDQIEEADSIKYLYMDTGLLYKNIDAAGVTININTTGINGNSGSTGAWTKGHYRGDIGSKHAIKMTVKYVATAPLNIIGLGVYLTRALDDTVYQLSANNLIHTELGPYISDTQISDTFKTYSIEAYYKIDPRTIDPNPDTDGTTKVIDVYVKNELTLKVSSGTAQFKQIQVMYDRVYG